MPCESFAQGLPPETRRRETVANQREDARNWDATAKEYLRELEAATANTQTDQRAVVYRIHLRLASLYETHYQYSEAEQYYERAGKCSQRSFWRTEWELVAALNRAGEMRVKQGRVQDADKSFTWRRKSLNQTRELTNSTPRRF